MTVLEELDITQYTHQGKKYWKNLPKSQEYILWLKCVFIYSSLLMG